MAFAAFAHRDRRSREPAPPAGARSRSSCCCRASLYLALFFLAPLVSLVLTTLPGARASSATSASTQTRSSWENYVDGRSQTYWPHIVRVVRLRARSRPFFALLISYPLAYFIGVKLRRYPLLQALALTLVIAPFFISFLLRTLAWKQILADEGPVVSAPAGARDPAGQTRHITGTRVLGGLRPHLQLHPVHDAADLHVARAARPALRRGRAATCTRAPRTTFCKVTLPLVGARRRSRARC